MRDKIQLSDHFTYRRLLRFTFPSMLMMMLTSIYGIVDGFFVSNFVGKNAFAAVNFIMPFLMIVGSLGFMFGSGGSAFIGKTLGEKNHQKANEVFSLLILTTFLCGIGIAIISIAFIRPIALFLGASQALLEDCIQYGRIILMALPFLMLQYAFSSLVVTAEKPKLGLVITVVSGVINMVGDALFMAIFHWGVIGAACATAFGQIIGGMVPLIYFSQKNKSQLRFVQTKWNGMALFKIATNGSSELMSNLSASIVGMLYNHQLMKYAGANGVAAYGTLMYVNFIFLAIFMGYSMGVAPVISYHYGAGNQSEIKNLLKQCLQIIACLSIAMVLLSEGLAGSMAKIFVGYDATLLKMTIHAFHIYGLSFLFSGTSIFVSGFFTALNDGLTSALISFLRTLVFESLSVLCVPLLLGLDGIWFSVVIAESIAILLSSFFLIKKRKQYQY